MSGFTDDDRNMLVATHTIVEAQKSTLKDHETRIRKNEKTVIIVGVIPILAGFILTIKKLFMA